MPSMRAVMLCENSSYNYQTGVYYMDVVSELERIGDFIINISQAEATVK